MYGHLDYSMKSLIISCKLFLLNDSVLLSVIKARPQNILKWKWQFPLFVAILIKWKFCLKISNASIIFTLRANIISVSLQHLIGTVSSLTLPTKCYLRCVSFGLLFIDTSLLLIFFERFLYRNKICSIYLRAQFLGTVSRGEFFWQIHYDKKKLIEK